MNNIGNITPYNFFFELPLYTSIEVNNEEAKETLRNLIEYRGNIDAYNPSLKENTTFSVSTNTGIGHYPRLTDADEYLQNVTGLRTTTLKCLRTKEEYCVFFMLFFDDESVYEIFKIGQYPSIADLHINKIKDYQSVLSKEKIKEFTKAIGLAANGVGIGSYVYLRRIFEHLLEQAHEVCKSSKLWNEDAYLKTRTAEKIILLKDELPDFLVENKVIYSILSKGIHELSEEECLNNFEILKDSIILILDERKDKYLKEQKIKQLTASIQKAQNKLK